MSVKCRVPRYSSKQGICVNSHDPHCGRHEESKQDSILNNKKTLSVLIQCEIEVDDPEFEESCLFSLFLILKCVFVCGEPVVPLGLLCQVGT